VILTLAECVDNTLRRRYNIVSNFLDLTVFLNKKKNHTIYHDFRSNCSKLFEYIM